MERKDLTIPELAQKIHEQQESANFSQATIALYDGIFKRLIKLAEAMGKEKYDEELACKFIQNDAYHYASNGEGQCRSRYLLHKRCVQFIESYIRDGVVDWSIETKLPYKKIHMREFCACLDFFQETLIEDGLRTNTRDGYIRFIKYFLSYLEAKGYYSLSQVKPGDITLFMVLVCQEHYSPTSLGSCVPGFRRFIKVFPELQKYECEIPEHIRKKVDITPTYTDEECDKIDEHLINGDMSARNRAIALIAFETGLRAVDICNLKLADIDWEKDVIQIQQTKTERTINIPLRPAMGNAIIDYLLEERPQVDSPYVFLRSIAPYNPITDHSGIYNVLHKIVLDAGVKPDGRISGTRMTRHNCASRMLREGVPLSVIAETLGHSDPNSTMRYLSTDAKMMASLTLPLPKEELYE